MIERRRHQIGHGLAKAPGLDIARKHRMRLRRGKVIERPPHAFGIAGRSGRIKHRGAEPLVRDRRRGIGRGRFVEVPDPLARARTVDDQAEADVRAIVECRKRRRPPGFRGDQRLRPAIVDDEGEFPGRQVRIDVGVIEAAPLAGRVALDVSRMVLHEDRIVIAALEAERAQEMRQPVAARLELAIGHGLSRPRHDDGRLIGARERVQARIHALPPVRQRRRPWFAFSPETGRASSKVRQDRRAVEDRRTDRAPCFSLATGKNGRNPAQNLIAGRQ